MFYYAVLTSPKGNTGYELVTEEVASGNTERTALTAAKALARSYENEGLRVTYYKLDSALYEEYLARMRRNRGEVA